MRRSVTASTELVRPLEKHSALLNVAACVHRVCAASQSGDRRENDPASRPLMSDADTERLFIERGDDLIHSDRHNLLTQYYTQSVYAFAVNYTLLRKNRLWLCL